MAIPFKVTTRRNPLNADAPAKYYPMLVTMGQTATIDTIAYDMKEASSLSIGDIKSVLANFVVAMRRALYNGHSVNIGGFGVFRLTAHCKGTEKPEDCTVKNIQEVRINFRASSSVKPSLKAKNAGDVMEFVDVEKSLENGKAEEVAK